ncbi:MAG: hypothetical protein WC344_00555 [Bacilli bacterium]|jgi:hypothetical protein
MDSLKTLIEKKQYALVLELTKDSLDVDSISYRIAAYLGLGKLEDALLLIEEHKSDFKDGIFNIMKVHFEVLFTLQKYDRAYQELKYYQNLPYISQEVEEYLNGADLMIRHHERKQRLDKKLSKEEINRILNSENDDVVLLAALNDIREYKMSEFYQVIIHFLKRQDAHSHVRTYALFLLVSDGYDKTVSFDKNDKNYKVVPKDLEPPFMNSQYDAILRRLETIAKDPSVSEVANSLLNELIIILYPDNIFSSPSELLIGALLVLAYEHLQIAPDIADLASNLNISINDLMVFVQKLQKNLESNPPIQA